MSGALRRLVPAEDIDLPTGLSRQEVEEAADYLESRLASEASRLGHGGVLVLEVDRSGMAVGVLVNGTRLPPEAVRRVETSYGPETGFQPAVTITLYQVRPTVVVVPDAPSFQGAGDLDASVGWVETPLERDPK